MAEEKIKINTETTEFSEKDDIKEGDELESTKAEMTGVREENSQLKSMLQKVEKDYKTLQMRFMDVIHEHDPDKNINSRHDVDREHELVSLRLGMVNDSCTQVRSTTSNSSKTGSDQNDELKLGLEYNFEGAIGCSGKSVDDLEGAKRSSPSTELKTQRSGGDHHREDISPTSAKKARVCVRARCDTPTMNDGCQWRKYGQKISKGNPCPRSYYRCTVSPNCPVRKQVQRSAEDMSILTTTYEGTHDHPLPLSATEMASTTSAAASMLLSGSTTSQPSATSAANSTVLYRPHFQSFNNPTTQPYYYYNSSQNAFPTITLDLTTNPIAKSSGFSLSPATFQTNPRVPATSLTFSPMNSNTIPTVWGSGGLSYGTLPYNNHHSLQFGKPLQEQSYQQYLEKFNQGQGSSQQALTETLTKVITSDPSFRSVIEAAISSMAENGGPEKVNNSKGNGLGPELKRGDNVPSADENSLT